MVSEKQEYDSTLTPLFDDTGRAFGQLVAWLVDEGRQITEPTHFVDALAMRLIDTGAPLWRMRLSFQTIHPQVEACAFTWTRGCTSAEFCLLHDTGDKGVPIFTPTQHDRPLRYRLDGLQPETTHPELQRWAADGAVDYVGIPVLFSTGATSWFIVATDSTAGFTAVDVANFEAFTKFLTPVLEVIATHRLARTLLNTYIGRRSGSRVLDGLIKRGDGETISAAIWLSDLRDSTHLTETLPRERLLALLNAYFELVAAAVTAHGGDVLRFIGDAMLAIFPVERGDTPAACAAALDAAVHAFHDLVDLNKQCQRAGESPIRFGVGLHVGEVIYGNVGAPDRLDFTVIGPAVNRTARLENLTKELGVPLLLSDDFARQTDRPIYSCGSHRMNGVAEPQSVFTLVEAPWRRSSEQAHSVPAPRLER
ncbi:MAG: adenylate/guanylate cyclase domain-containing protein [Acidiferrobacterales bacterium]